MKITNYTKSKLKPGVTLIELTVVIVVILSLIAVLFIGAQAYRNGASRSACVVLLRTIHTATRSHQNLNNGFAGGELQDGAMTIQDAIVNSDGSAFLTQVPTCPRMGGSYSGLTDTMYPAPGVVNATCDEFGETGSVEDDGHEFFEAGAP